jgi:hypothetical protein
VVCWFLLYAHDTTVPLHAYRYRTNQTRFMKRSTFIILLYDIIISLADYKLFQEQYTLNNPLQKMADATNNICTACGWLSAIISCLSFGSFAVPIKCKAARECNVDPLVFQSYKTFMCFATALIAPPIL